MRFSAGIILICFFLGITALGFFGKALDYVSNYKKSMTENCSESGIQEGLELMKGYLILQCVCLGCTAFLLLYLIDYAMPGKVFIMVAVIIAGTFAYILPFFKLRFVLKGVKHPTYSVDFLMKSFTYYSYCINILIIVTAFFMV